MYSLARLQNAVSMYQARSEPQCVTDTGMLGSCISNLQCRRRNGRMAGICRAGIITKTCCQEVRTCDQEATRNNTYFQNPTSSNQHVQCRLHVRKLPAVCQLRLDFHQFSIRGPDASTGKCDRDRFSVHGQDSNSVIPPICGENQGQHGEQPDRCGLN